MPGGCLAIYLFPRPRDTMHPSLHSPWQEPESTSLLDAQLPHLLCVCGGTGWKPAPVCQNLRHPWLPEVWREAELGIVLVGRVQENQSEIERAQGFICFHEKTTSYKKEPAGRATFQPDILHQVLPAGVPIGRWPTATAAVES